VRGSSWPCAWLGENHQLTHSELIFVGLVVSVWIGAAAGGGGVEGRKRSAGKRGWSSEGEILEMERERRQRDHSQRISSCCRP
jgi:hypothetical protein